MNRKISICLTNYNRYDLLLKSFEQVLNDDRISEIIIVDDHSNAATIASLQALHFTNGKVHIHYNDHNLGVYRNKKRSVELASNEWVIVFDSDNIMTPGYLDRIYSIGKWDDHTSYLPAKAKPKFNYSQFSGMSFDRSNIAQWIRVGQMDCAINCMNYLTNRGQYLKHWDPTVEPISADSIYVNYLQLKAGNKLYVVPGLEYEHLIHAGSHYVLNQHKSTEFHKKIMNKLIQMR